MEQVVASQHVDGQTFFSEVVEANDTLKIWSLDCLPVQGCTIDICKWETQVSKFRSEFIIV